MYTHILNIKKSFTLVTLLFTIAFSVAAQEWKIDKNHSSFNFEVNHFFTPVIGSFNDFKGEFSFDPNDLDNSHSRFTIKIASIDTGNDKRDSDLKSANFFEEGRFPEIIFVSTKFLEKGGAYIIVGNLTIKDITKEVEVPFQVLGLGVHPNRKSKELIGIKAKFTILRNDYGVGSGNWATTAVVGDEVLITIMIEASRSN